MKLSCYLYLFNARKFDFDLDGMVVNFVGFFDEVVVATIPGEDDTYERLKGWEQLLGSSNFRVIMTDISLSSNRFDGDLKTVALQACSKSSLADPRCYVIADGDERFPASNRDKWVDVAERLYASPYDGVLIPVLDLYGDDNHVRADRTTGYKFRLHTDAVVKRGVIPSAELGDGLFDTSKSDGTEPLVADGELAFFTSVLRNPTLLWPDATRHLVEYPYVLHYGHLDSERRAKINREFWREHWKNRSGKEPDMVLDASSMKDIPLITHGLPLR